MEKNSRKYPNIIGNISMECPPEKILIKYHNPELKKIEKISIGDWCDLRAAENIALSKGESAIVSLGISCRLPEGYEAHIAPRSSTYKIWSIIQTNSIGI